MGDAVELVDSRRLTGPNIHTPSPGAVLELRVDAGVDVDALVERWSAALRRGLDALGWDAQLHERRFEGQDGAVGVELMFTAAVDRLYAATELGEWALALARGEPEQAGALEVIAAAARREQGDRRGALELIAAAERRGVPWLIDDDELSLGYFARSVCWPVDALPRPVDVDWSALGPGKLALITGTNGKTTTTRLLTRIAIEAGLRVGNTSTDGLYQDERLVEAGDWTGPGGARAILRNPELDLAVLEAARGGLLRRGAGVRSCTVAVITNIADDHLGEYGVLDLFDMAVAKGVAASIVEPGGRVVLGADSPPLLDWACEHEEVLAAPIVWFCLDPEHGAVLESRAAGGEVWTIVDGWLVRIEGGQTTRVCEVAAEPIGFGGLARHNLQNALAAAAAARGLGLDDEAIAAGLRGFGPADNPGRVRMWTLETARGRIELLFDFAHNVAGLLALAELVRGLGKPPIVCFGMAGDRSDRELLAQAVFLLAFSPRAIVLGQKLEYARGRDAARITRVLGEGLERAGYPREAVIQTDSEVASLDAAVELARDGEIVVVLAHIDHEGVGEWLRTHAARPDPPDGAG